MFLNLFLNLVIQTQVDTRKPAFRWLGMGEKPKAENDVTVAVSPARKDYRTKEPLGLNSLALT